MFAFITEKRIVFYSVWRLFARFLVLTTALLLGFLNKPAFEKWYKEHRRRIHSKPRRHQDYQRKPNKLSLSPDDNKNIHNNNHDEDIKPTSQFATLIEEQSSDEE
jgi:hypothetical protein